MKLTRSVAFRSAVALLAVLVAVGALAAFVSPKATKQCRVLFGPGAATKVIIEVDDENLWLYRNGVAEGRPERFALADDHLADDTTIEIHGANESTRYTITYLSRYREEGETPRDSLMFYVDMEDGSTRYRQYCDVELRPAGDEPAIAHFHGPLTVQAQTVYWKLPEWTRLVQGDAKNQLRAVIGTLDGKRGCWTVMETHEGDQSNFPEGVFPYVDIEFPPIAPGEPGPKKRFPLDQFC